MTTVPTPFMTPACGSGYDAEAWLQSAAGRLTKEIEAESVKKAQACAEAERLRAFAETPAFLNGLQEKLAKAEAEAAMKKAAAAAVAEVEAWLQTATGKLANEIYAEVKAAADNESQRRHVNTSSHRALRWHSSMADPNPVILREFARTPTFLNGLKEKLEKTERIVKDAEWCEGWIEGLRADEAGIEAKRLQIEADIQSAKSVVEQFPFREAETIQLYETTTFRELAEEQRRLDAKKAVAIAQHQEELNRLAKACEAAVSQLQRLRAEPIPRNSAQEILSNTAMYDPCPSAATGDQGPTNSVVGWLSHYKEKAEPAKKMVDDIKVAMATLQ